jgi:hypothetical protein
LKNNIICLICLLAIISPAFAWSEACSSSILSDALNLMPENFKLFVKHYDKEFWNPGGLSSSQPDDQAIISVIEMSDKAASLIRKQESLSESVRLIGRIASRVINLCSPEKSLKNNSSLNTDYAIYLEKNKGFFFIKWPGIDRRPKSGDALKSLLTAALARIQMASDEAKKCFEADHKPVSEYDRQSVPFGSGSLAYSTATASTGMTWLYLWDAAGGIKSSK